jgi:methionyl-tRNA synthetase
VRSLFTILFVVLMTAACGGEPPNKEIQQARTALDAAVAAGADHWAAEELSAAQEALKRADEAVAQRDYRLALNHALDSLERAQGARQEATTRKAAARDQADRAIGGATSVLTATTAKIKTLEPRTPARTLSTARAAVTTAEEHVQEARAAYGRGDWQAAGTATAAAMQALTAANSELDALAPAQKPRKR